MDKRDFLYRLIHSMNQSEKRFFKLYSNLYSSKKEKHYIILFELYEKQTVYNEKEIKEALAEVAEVGNFNVLRKYLKEQILSSLKLFHRKKEKELTKYDELQSVILLIRKGFYIEAEKILTKLIKNAIAEENIGFALLCFTKLINISEHVAISSLDGMIKTNELCEKRSYYLGLYTEYWELQNIYRKTKVIVFKQTQFVKLPEKLRAILENEIIPIENKISGVKAKLLLHYCKSYIYRNLYEEENSLKELEGIERLLTQNPGINSKVNYGINLVNLCFGYIFIKQNEKYLEKKQLLEVLLKENGEHQKILFHWKFILCYEFYYANLDQEFPKTLNKEVLSYIEKEGGDLFEKQKTALHFRLARFYFFDGNTDKAITQLNAILQNDVIDWSNHYFFSIHFLLLFCYLETKDDFLFKQKLTFLKRKVKREQLNRDELTEVFRFLSKLTKNKENNKLIYKDLKKMLEVNTNELLFEEKLNFILKWTSIKLDAK